MARHRLPAPKKSFALPATEVRRLTDEQFHRLASLPTVMEWLADIQNERTRRAYGSDLRDFVAFTGIRHPDEFAIVKRAHFIAWRKSLEERKLSPATIRRKLSAMTDLYDYFCDANAIPSNPVKGVKRPSEGTNEGKTPALGNLDAARLLEAPPRDTLKGKRDRAILAVFLYHGLRCGELAALRVRDIHRRSGIQTLRVFGKRSKTRNVEAHPVALQRIADYLRDAGHGDDVEGPLFRPLHNSRGHLRKSLSSTAIYECVVMHYAKQIGIADPDFCVHSLRATAATNALDNGGDPFVVQDWLGHASVSTTRLYDKRRRNPEDSPTFKVDYSKR